ncbi:MAG: hypothetical protein ACWGSD_11100 [Thermodesulfobacteriota bacterium]
MKHLEDQPYALTCSECGDDLELPVRVVDEDGDITLEVAPCETCLGHAAAEGGF